MTQLTYNLFQDIILKGTTVMLLVAVLSGVATPRAVDAQVEVPLQDPMTTLFMDQPDTEPASFPVSGERKGIERSVVFTAYTSHQYQTDSTPFLPADGKDYRIEFEKYGVVRAIASNDYRLGTKLRIVELEEYFPDVFAEGTIFVVTDRMNKRYTGKNRMDLYLLLSDENGDMDLDSSLTAAKKFGVKRLTGEIL